MVLKLFNWDFFYEINVWSGRPRQKSFLFCFLIYNVCKTENVVINKEFHLKISQKFVKKHFWNKISVCLNKSIVFRKNLLNHI